MTDKQQDAAADLLIKEVDEDLRHERLVGLWKRYGALAIGGALAIVLAVVGWQGWSAWQADQRRDSSRRFQEAAALIDQGRRDDAAAILNGLVEDGTGGYRLLAELRLADLRQQQGDIAAAVVLYRRIVADGAIDAAYREMASIRAAYLTVDEADPAEIVRSVEPLAVEASAWRHSAREILAITALRQGNKPRAIEMFARIAEDAAAPEAIRGRAAEMLAVIGQSEPG